MIQLAQPWLLLALPLPLLAAWLLPRARESGSALRVPCYEALSLHLGAGAATAGSRVVVALKALAWCALVLAAAQPQWVGAPEPVGTRGRDLMLAVDLSGSMATEDFALGGRAVDRFTAVRAVAREFVRHREGDRLGLILFGSRPYLQAPLTTDRDSVASFLDDGEVGLAGQETAIGDAIGLAVKHLRDRPAPQKVLVLLSDGANNVGTLDPIAAAKLAAQAGIRIYTIGVGSEAPVVRTPFGLRRLGGAELDEKTLRKIAQLTGGSYFRAQDTASLARTYREIDALEPTEGEAAEVRPTVALFTWPLGAALAIAAALAAARALEELRGALSAPLAQREGGRTA